jgi:AcrR family transcriptional regulator
MNMASAFHEQRLTKAAAARRRVPAAASDRTPVPSGGHKQTSLSSPLDAGVLEGNNGDVVTGKAEDFDSPRRRQLLETAWRMFYREGYRAVGIDALLAESGVAKMTLYHHFRSKEELIRAVLRRRSAEILRALDDAVKGAGRSPERRLLAVFDWLDSLFSSNDFMGCAFIRAMSEYPDRKDPIFQAAWAHKMAVRKMLAGLASEAGVRDPGALADALRLLIDGAIVAAHATGSGKPAAAARTVAARLLRAARE